MNEYQERLQEKYNELEKEAKMKNTHAKLLLEVHVLEEEEVVLYRLGKKNDLGYEKREWLGYAKVEKVTLSENLYREPMGRHVPMYYVTDENKHLYCVTYGKDYIRDESKEYRYYILTKKDWEKPERFQFTTETKVGVGLTNEDVKCLLEYIDKNNSWKHALECYERRRKHIKYVRLYHDTRDGSVYAVEFDDIVGDNRKGEESMKPVQFRLDHKTENNVKFMNRIYDWLDELREDKKEN